MTELNNTEPSQEVEVTESLNVPSERVPENATEKKTPETEMTEFKITVRKLEMPVRPRGVLAE